MTLAKHVEASKIFLKKHYYMSMVEDDDDDDDDDDDGDGDERVCVCLKNERENSVK